MIRLKTYRIMLAAAAVCLSMSGCVRNGMGASSDNVNGTVGTYPDYKEVTIPANIAPLNFHFTDENVTKAVTTFTVADKTVRIKGYKVEWPVRKWKSFISGAEGETIHVQAELRINGQPKTESWDIYVSEDQIDAYLTYRLIEPSFQMFHELSMKERCIENFDETTICDYTVTENSCMNCHIHAQQRGDLSMFYIRGAKGGAILNRDGKLRKLNLKDGDMISGTVYGEIHPSGKYGVFSTNVILPSLHTSGYNRMEVYDSASDLTVADFDNNEMINLPHLARADKFETFPCFSADGNEVFYCVADTVALPQDIMSMKYSLMRAAFDSSNGHISEQADTLWSASEHNGSVCHPKASPDGKWIMFTVADYGTFPIDHRESGLRMINLETEEINTLDGIKSDDSGSDTYHSWSSNSRWLVFASKRGDGQYAKPYICHIDENGNTTKPFVLPQKSSKFYEMNLKSFNIPDIGSSSIGISIKDSKRLFKAESEAFE